MGPESAVLKHAPRVITSIQLLVVIAIIAMLAGVFRPGLVAAPACATGRASGPTDPVLLSGDTRINFLVGLAAASAFSQFPSFRLAPMAKPWTESLSRA